MWYDLYDSGPIQTANPGKHNRMATYGKVTQNQHSSHVWFPFVFSNWLFCPSIIYRSNLLLNPNKASQFSLKWSILIGGSYSGIIYSLLDSIYWGRTLAVFRGSFTPVFGHRISFQLTGSKRKPYLFVASITPKNKICFQILYVGFGYCTWDLETLTINCIEISLGPCESPNYRV